MSMLWIDGFEGYHVGSPWGGGSGNHQEGYNGGVTGDDAIVAPGRGGVGQAFQASFASNTTRILPPVETIVIGYAIKGPIIGNSEPHFWLGDAAAGHLAWGVNIINEFFFTGPNWAVNPITPVFTIPRFTDAWRYVELKITPHPTNGAIVLRVDNVEHLNISGIQTVSTVGAGREYRYRRVTTNVNSGQYDDFYILDTTGPAPWNDFLGDSRMFIIKPNGPHTTNWTPSTGVDNWDLVNEAQTDHADYVESKVLGTKDLYEYEDPALPPGTVIHAIATMTSARRVEEAGPRAIKAHVLSGATEVEGGFHQLSDTWYMEQFILETDPDTGAPWTVAGLNALKAGFEIEV